MDYLKFFRSLGEKKNLIPTIAIIVFLIIIGIGSFTVHHRTALFNKHYSEVYTLVSDKISKSAPIIINLPKGTSKVGAEEKVTFTPKIKGEWKTVPLENSIAFQPSADLELGKYYHVSLAIAHGEINKDFQADENPKINEIFPKADSEADESSSITIIFNRPMVPLSTLTENEVKDIPVTITPKTEGKFKWISTRNLQFIPTKHLVRSTHYKVVVGNGLVSLDGLPVEGTEQTFTTRPLRFIGATSASINFNQSADFHFNQPVDLAKTSQAIHVRNVSTNSDVAFDTAYGYRSVYNSDTHTFEKIQDPSVISVFPKKDHFGREHLWDFDTNYTATVNTAYPIDGDISFNQPMYTNFQTTGIIANITAQSDKTALASPTLFDPAGKVTITFNEDIDLSKSSINAKGLTKTEYGKKCDVADGEDVYNQSGCVKIDDHASVILTFDQSKFNKGETVPITFSKIINTDGLQINGENVVRNISVYPELKITKITPAQSATNASLTDMVICTNSPLKPKAGKDFYDSVKADKYIVFARWDEAYLQTGDYFQSNPPCANGEYVNSVHYGLLPDTQYQLTVSVEDVFGQQRQQHLSVATESAPKFYLAFQNLQKIYNVTTPDHTTFTYGAENFDKVNLSICKVEPGQMVRYLNDLPSKTASNSSLNCQSTVNDTIELPPNLWVNNYFQVNLAKYFTDTRGQYILSFTNPKFKDDSGDQLYDRTYVSVTNLAVSEKKVNWTKYDSQPEKTKNSVAATTNLGSLYWVTRIHSLDPVVGAQVRVFHDTGEYGTKPQPAQSLTTNDSGIAEFPLIKDIVGAVITSGDDTAIVSRWSDTLNNANSADTVKQVYMYTDRPIYRPGQQVNVKGLYRYHFDGNYEIYQDQDVAIKVNDTKGNTLFTQNVPVSKYGTFNASFTLPDNAPLGSYYITALDQYAGFDVQEYEGAAFEAKAETSKDEYIAGETADISVLGKYYFGVPVDGGTLDYTFTAQNYYFDKYTDEYFNFGSDWYSCYDCGYGDTYIKRGKTTLDAQGVATISQQLDFNSLFKESDRNNSKIVVLHGTIKDKQGKSVSFQKSFIVHRGEVYLGIKADPYFVGEKQPFTLRAKTVNTSGKAVGKGDITVVFNKVEWQSFKRQEVDGGYYNRYERVLTPVLTKNISTDGNGNHSEQITLNAAGEYEITATTKDSRGNDIKTTSSLYVYGSGTVSVRPTNNASLDIQAFKTDLNVGDTGKIIFQSPYKNAKALITLERGNIFDYKIVNVDKNVFEYEFPVKAEDVPNVYASVVLLSGDPEVKFGQQQFMVNRKEKELTINVKADKTSYLPGEKVTLNVTTADIHGVRVPAEVSVAVADLSVLALKGNPKKDPLMFFYNGFPLAVTTGTNIKNLLQEVAIPTGTKGGDGGSPGDLATKKRGEFKDTAFWQANIETNDRGEAQVSFTLPDNLTRWQIETIGITKDTKLGVKYQEITAQKNIMAVPIKPRFVVPGDEFMVGAKIFNQTQTTQSLDVTFTSPSLKIFARQGKTQVRLKAGESTTVYFNVQAPTNIDTGEHTFTIAATNKDYNDTVENTIAITRNESYESVATANSTIAKNSTEYVYIPDSVIKDRGGITVKSSATLGVYLSDALKSLIDFPNGSSESLASTLSSIAIVKRGLAVKNVGEQFNLPPLKFNNKSYSVDEAVQIGLNSLYDTQTPEGGFAYYKGMKPNVYLSIDVLTALQDLRDAKYDVKQSVIDQTEAYIRAQVLGKGESYYRANPDLIDMLIDAQYALSRSSQGLGQIDTLIQSLANKSFINEGASSDTLGHLAILAVREEYPASFKNAVFTSLENRVDIDSRGAYVKSNGNNLNWYFYETPVKNTALLVKALSLDKREYSQTDKLMRWILAGRTQAGAWESSNTTLAVIDAFTDYLTWKREIESNFTLDIALDGKTVQTNTFDSSDILAIKSETMPISQFETGSMHTLSFTKTNKNDLPNTLYYDIGLTYFIPVEELGPRDEGITIERNFYSLTDTKEENPLETAKVGDVIKGKITFTSPKPRHQFAIEDYIPAGFELVNFDLATEDQSSIDASQGVVQSTTPQTISYKGGFWKQLGATFGFYNTPVYDETLDTHVFKNPYYPDFKEVRDNSLYLFSQDLPAGTYTYEYYVRATTAGTFRHLPAVARELYFPENFGRTAGSLFKVEQ